MSSFGVKLPLTRDSADGFTSLKMIQDTVRQNLKMLILTNPGEKIMDVNYGVGIKAFLFSSRYNFTKSEIEQKIRDQIKFYMPAVLIRKIDFNIQQDQQTLSLSIFYDIPDIGTKDLIQIVL